MNSSDVIEDSFDELPSNQSKKFESEGDSEDNNVDVEISIEVEDSFQSISNPRLSNNEMNFNTSLSNRTPKRISQLSTANNSKHEITIEHVTSSNTSIENHGYQSPKKIIESDDELVCPSVRSRRIRVIESDSDDELPINKSSEDPEVTETSTKSNYSYSATDNTENNSIESLSPIKYSHQVQSFDSIQDSEAVETSIKSHHSFSTTSNTENNSIELAPINSSYQEQGIDSNQDEFGDKTKNYVLDQEKTVSLNDTYRETRNVNTKSENSSDEEDVIDVSSADDDDDISLKNMNVPEMKNKLPTPIRTTKLQDMIQNMTLKNSEIKQDDKYYCTSAEYSNQATKVSLLRTDALKCKNALRTVNLNSLPDKGALLRHRQYNLEKQLTLEEEKLKNMVLQTKAEKGEKNISWNQLVENSNCVVPKTFGKQAMNTYSSQKSLTMDRLKNLHDSLATCPDEKTLAEDPIGLKIELMNHQRRALAWLTWREGQKPAGGILADDMGLGKTLTMISLILKTKDIELKENSDSENEEPHKDEWTDRKSKLKAEGGTLVICPATLIGQWEGEIQKRLKRNLLNVELYHGLKRETKISRLAKYDVVITTYKLVQGQYEKKGTLFNIKWKRIILDEAHVVRNYKSQTSVAICGLISKTRWALTGTPVHNKELDLYALLKFLRCSPFDDISVWKQWVANKTSGGQDRLNTVMTSILLRRTKAQLQNEGALQGLPERKFEEIYIDLDDEEKKVYQKVLLFSRNLFIEFLRQREAKNPDMIYMRGSCPEVATNDEQYNKMHQKMLNMYGGANVKSHQILVLLLRLRQICCHPSLIHAILDDENCVAEGIEEHGVDTDLFDKFTKMNLENNEETETPQASSEPENLDSIANKLLSSTNPVFNSERPNEKLRIIKKIIEEKVIPNDDKIIIVSQWTSMLQIIYKHLKKFKINCDLLDGSVPVNKRNDLVNCFNDPKQPVKVLLLSLTAGGVGLNLVGANHLLLVDLHWNPQLESQAQDRIYRVGQKKTVHVYKIITSETIEQRIKSLQDNKLSMASNILAGTRAVGANKLSLDDLKMLFNIGPQVANNK